MDEQEQSNLKEIGSVHLCRRLLRSCVHREQFHVGIQGFTFVQSQGYKCEMSTHKAPNNRFSKMHTMKDGVC